MNNYIESKASLIKIKIEKDLNKLNEKEIEKFFDKFRNIRGMSHFIEYYNRTVLDGEEIDFYEFDRQWATNLIRFNKRLLEYFQKNKKRIIAEIKTKSNIEEFYKKYCSKEIGLKISKRNEVSFCSKLFHTILPDKYPPVDSCVREQFDLPLNIASVLIIKKAYEDYIKDNKSKIGLVRKVLSKKKFLDFRVKELSNMRILDMFYLGQNRIQNKGKIDKRFSKSKLLHVYQLENGQIAIRATDSRHKIMSHKIAGKILPSSVSNEKLGRGVREIFKRCGR